MSVVSFPRNIGAPVLIGRAAQLEILARALDETRAGQGQIILLAGEAGIGKSRLAQETTRLAAERDFFILQGRCFDQDRALPYAPFIDLLRVFLREGAGEAFQRNGSTLLGEETFHRNVSTLLSELTSPPFILHPSSLIPSPDAAHAKRKLFLALLQFLASQTPRVMVIEDLHWADDVTLEFLLFLARQISSHALLVLLTYRAEELNPQLENFLATLEREWRATEIVLARLTRAETAELIGAHVAMPRAEFLEAMFELTEGNPFFTEEVLKALGGASDRAALDDLKIPRTIQAAVQTRVAQISAPAQRVLRHAAVAGRRFDFVVLGRVMDMTENDLLDALKEALTAQLVVEESADEFAFRHELTRQATYNSMLLRERKQLHRAVGETMEALYAGDARSGELAHHFFAAGEWHKAYSYALRAGEQAQQQYAPRAAVEQFTRAVDAANALDGRGIDLGAVYRERAHAYEILGEFEKARADYLQGLDLARTSGARRDEWQALLNLGFLWAARDASSTQTYLEQALYVARELNEPATLARTLNRVGNWNAISLHSQRAHALHHEALEIFEQLDDERGRAETFDLLGVASLIGGDFVSSASFFERAIPLWRALKEPRGLSSSLTAVAMSSASYAADALVTPPVLLRDKVRLGEEALRLAREIEWRAGEALASIALAMSFGGMGEYGRAFESARRGLELAREIEHRQNTTLAHWILGVLYLDVFALEEAREHLEQALENAYVSAPNWVPLTLRRLANVFIEQEDFSRAEGLLNTFLTPDLAARAPGERGVWTARAELALAQGDYKFAQQIAARLVADAAQMEIFGIASMPRVALLYGEALMATRRKKDAAQFLDAALETARARELRGLLWHALIARGKLFQTTARGDAAREKFAEARALIGRLADSIPDARVRENFLKHASARIPQTHAPTRADLQKKKFGGLSVRERQIVARVAKGESNREIADALVLSQRTVESHIANVMSKLGVGSRAQIAAWAVGKGMRDEG